MLYYNRIMLKEVSIFFFFFFFEKLYNIPDIHYAFEKICTNKILVDGYCDMSHFINGEISAEEMRYRLAACKSKYIELYHNTRHPNEETAVNAWYELFGQSSHNVDDMLMEEATAIVYWVYMIFPDAKERKSFTFELFSNVKELASIECHIEYNQGVFYNSKTVELKFVSSIAEFNETINAYQKGNDVLYYRGHANSNYQLKPSIARKTSWLQNEREIYNRLLITCPADFEKCNSHFEKLVKMQHYGLPTRLLDITQNALVALYFACESQFENYGEIILISSKKNAVYYPQSDTASILASLPAFSYDTQQKFLNLALDPSITKKEFNKKTTRLLHEIRLEKPAFGADINKLDLLKNIIILANKNNNRIVKQDGAFILCGLSDDFNALNEFRYKKKGKAIVILVSNKKKILEQLSTFSINYATLFPEVDCVANYLKNSY